MDTCKTLPLVLNGKEQDVPEGTSLRKLVESMGVDPARVVVERNLGIVEEKDLDKETVAAGDRIEVIHFVGGG